MHQSDNRMCMRETASKDHESRGKTKVLARDKAENSDQAKTEQLSLRTLIMTASKWRWRLCTAASSTTTPCALSSSRTIASVGSQCTFSTWVVVMVVVMMI